MNDRVVADKEAGAEKEQVDKLTLDEDRPEGARRIHLHDIQDDAEAEANAVDKADLVGAALRAQRLKQGLDLAQVSSDLKIRRPYLEALEDSRDSALPGRAYAIGFVRTYATYLGMDAKKIVDLFKVETDPETELVDERLAEEYPYVEAGPERRWPKGSLLILLLISFAAIYGAWQLSFSVDQMVSGRGASVSPSNSSTDAGVAPVASFPALGREAVVAETDPASGGEEGETDVTLETLPTLTSPILTPPASAQTPAVETEAVPLAEGNQYGVGGADETAASAGRVTLRALKNDSWLRVEAADGTALFSETLKAGDTYVTPDQQGLVMVARDAGAFEILVDEKSIGLAGPNGLVLTGLSLDPDDLGN